MDSFLYTLLAVPVYAACTFATRVVPFALFGRKRAMPPAVRRLAMKLPAAIIAVLVVYCLKDAAWLTAPHGAPELLAIAVVVLLHRWRGNVLLSIAGGTAVYMLLVQTVFAAGL